LAILGEHDKQTEGNVLRADELFTCLCRDTDFTIFQQDAPFSFDKTSANFAPLDAFFAARSAVPETD
jgi:hypothetical protein